jgi:hypothetical protein
MVLQPGPFGGQAPGGIARCQRALHRLASKPELRTHCIVVFSENILSRFRRHHCPAGLFPDHRSRGIRTVSKLLGADPHPVKLTIARLTASLSYLSSDGPPTPFHQPGQYFSRRLTGGTWRGRCPLGSPICFERERLPGRFELIEQGQIACAIEHAGQFLAVDSPLPTQLRAEFSETLCLK